MTSPADAAATSRDTTYEYIYPASQLDDADTPGPRSAFTDPPRPVPMTDPIDDVTAPSEGA